MPRLSARKRVALANLNTNGTQINKRFCPESDSSEVPDIDNPFQTFKM